MILFEASGSLKKIFHVILQSEEWQTCETINLRILNETRFYWPITELTVGNNLRPSP